ncbi:exosortase H-associated membrane protein [Haliea atlantica]|jgi:hypothetical protein|nr:hypothetical protein [Haliea sp.]MAL94132.1 hypothetical protein [Haliea sp.]|tara:strand:- start:1473 stop:2075 length:603 start_codon:yes stop_codon:yes gene_type:complete
MSVYRFVGLVILLMLPCFALWYALGNLTPAPGLWLGQALLSWSLPGVVDEVVFRGHELLVMTNFGEAAGQVVPLDRGEYQLGYPINTRALTYCIPFYAALHFAARVPQSLSRFVTALFALWALIALGIFAVGLKNLMLGLGDTLFTEALLPLPPPAVIALLFQFFTLIMPTVAPVLLWAWASRDSGLLEGMLRQRRPSPP